MRYYNVMSKIPKHDENTRAQINSRRSGERSLDGDPHLKGGPKINVDASRKESTKSMSIDYIIRENLLKILMT